MKRGLKISFVFLLVLVVVLSFASASVFSNIWGKITGTPIVHQIDEEEGGIYGKTCSDGGINAYTPDVCRDLSGDHEDYCVNDNLVMEYSCSGDYCLPSQASCGQGTWCDPEKGACVSASEECIVRSARCDKSKIVVFHKPYIKDVLNLGSSDIKKEDFDSTSEIDSACYRLCRSRGELLCKGNVSKYENCKGESLIRDAFMDAGKGVAGVYSASFSGDKLDSISCECSSVSPYYVESPIGCYDSDVPLTSNGINLFNKGSCTDKEGNVYNDKCVDSTHVQEYTCSSYGSCSAVVKQCPEGNICNDSLGRCVISADKDDKDEPSFNCEDSDADVSNPYGKNYFVAGGFSQYSRDKCEGNILVEYYCSKFGKSVSEKHDCSKDGMICDEGKCVEKKNAPSCSEKGDKGIDIHNRGSIGGVEEKCDGSSFVIEYSCEDPSQLQYEGALSMSQVKLGDVDAYSLRIPCPSGEVCDGGVCVKETPSQDECKDTDGNKNYLKRGTVSFNGKTYTDLCTKPLSSTKLVLKEYYCSNNQLKYVFHDCSDEGMVCDEEKGACVEKNSNGGDNGKDEQSSLRKECLSCVGAGKAWVPGFVNISTGEKGLCIDKTRKSSEIYGRDLISDFRKRKDFMKTVSLFTRKLVSSQSCMAYYPQENVEDPDLFFYYPFGKDLKVAIYNLDKDSFSEISSSLRGILSGSEGLEFDITEFGKSLSPVEKSSLSKTVRNRKVVRYFEIKSSDPDVPGTINMTINASEYDWPVNNLSIYVSSDGVNDWEEAEIISIKNLGDNLYEITVQAPHFSVFAITEPDYCGNGVFDGAEYNEECDGSANCTAECTCAEGFVADGKGNCTSQENIEGTECSTVDEEKCVGYYAHYCKDDLTWSSGHIVKGRCGVECTEVGNITCDGEIPMRCGANYQWMMQPKIDGLCGYRSQSSLGSGLSYTGNMNIVDNSANSGETGDVQDKAVEDGKGNQSLQKSVLIALLILLGSLIMFIIFKIFQERKRR